MADVVVARVEDDGIEGWGECVPYSRYEESPGGIIETIQGFRGPFDRQELLGAMPPGAARNAIDCALWDLEAKRTGGRAWELVGLPPPQPVATVFTIALATPEAMERKAAEHQHHELKVKLGDDPQADIERLRAVRQGAPGAGIIVDANEGWDLDALTHIAPIARDLGVRMIEQPLPQGADAVLAGYDAPLPLGADESFHGDENLAELRQCYDVVNIKLDKTGGLTAALAIAAEAEAAGFSIMVGCMVATSLAMAPAMLLAGAADFVDLDGPLLLTEDRPHGLQYANGQVSPPGASLWG